MNKHPNALAALVSGVGIGNVLIWALGFAGVAVPDHIAVTLGGGLAALVLLIGREGVRGLAGILWSGQKP